GGLLGDAAAAVVKNGELAAAIEESKLTRLTSAGRGGLPEAAIAACLSLAGARAEQVDAVAIARPLAPGPEAAFHLGLRERFPNARVLLLEHHAAHAASAYYASPYEQATVLVLDRAGDFRCGSRWQAEGNRLTLKRELYYPDSLGELYGRVTRLLDLEANREEHKVQWLSMLGEGRYRGLFLEIIGLRDNHWPRLDRSFFDAERTTRGGFSAKFFDRLGLRDAVEIPAGMRAEIAAGIQQAIEETAVEMAGRGENLCFAGGLGLNALLVSALERSARFENVFVQPAAGNAGTAIGAALEAWHGLCQQSRRVDLGSACLGPSFAPEHIKQMIENCKLRFRYLLTTGELIDTAIAQLSDNKIVAWMHGRMEFGSRALGNRSILASPLNPYSSENLNAYIKHREAFRKFAASAPAEAASEYFDVGPNARFLATVGRVREAYREKFQSALLARDLIRVHTVAERDNPLYWKLLHAAGKATGLPVLYNTSFNLFGEPLVCTPRDAVRSFYSSGIDAMFVGNFLLQK
ncbi:MAG: carbamoyltransferase, partial [Acidobacteria bacterium]|nr:carbamoyltransferase [Acidobacteriota bacterium]